MAQSLSLTLLNSNWSEEPFPPVELAWQEPNGLLAVGGDLSVKRLVNAYKAGIFPWFGPREPIYWWSPNPRTVLFPHKIRLTRSLRKSLRNKNYRITFDTCFADVVHACAAPRSYSSGTWITNEMHTAYCRLHAADLAHSIEVWNSNNELVGGLYGVSIGGVFSGESMFSREPQASKVALTRLQQRLAERGYILHDTQWTTPHLAQFGGHEIPHAEYLKLLRQAVSLPVTFG